MTLMRLAVHYVDVSSPKSGPACTGLECVLDICSLTRQPQNASGRVLCPVSPRPNPFVTQDDNSSTPVPDAFFDAVRLGVTARRHERACRQPTIGPEHEACVDGSRDHCRSDDTSRLAARFGGTWRRRFRYSRGESTSKQIRFVRIAPQSTA